MSAFLYLCGGAAWLIIVILAVDTCQTDKDCPKDQCCQILKHVMIASRKRSPRLQLDANEKEGTCQKFKRVLDVCNGLEEANGFCGCSPGLECSRYVSTNTTVMRSRRDMALPKPGCSTEQRCLPRRGDC